MKHCFRIYFLRPENGETLVSVAPSVKPVHDEVAGEEVEGSQHAAEVRKLDKVVVAHQLCFFVHPRSPVALQQGRLLRKANAAGMTHQFNGSRQRNPGAQLFMKRSESSKLVRRSDLDKTPQGKIPCLICSPTRPAHRSRKAAHSAPRPDAANSEPLLDFS